jgi:IS5 family transposase
VLPTAGRASAERQCHERRRWFRRGFRFRAGIDERISLMRRGYELDRCRDHWMAGLDWWIDRGW